MPHTDIGGAASGHAAWKTGIREREASRTARFFALMTAESARMKVGVRKRAPAARTEERKIGVEEENWSAPEPHGQPHSCSSGPLPPSF